MTEQEAREGRVTQLELEVRLLRHAMFLDAVTWQKQLRQVAASADFAHVSYVAIYGDHK